MQPKLAIGALFAIVLGVVLVALFGGDATESGVGSIRTASEAPVRPGPGDDPPAPDRALASELPSTAPDAGEPSPRTRARVEAGAGEIEIRVTLPGEAQPSPAAGAALSVLFATQAQRESFRETDATERLMERSTPFTADGAGRAFLPAHGDSNASYALVTASAHRAWGRLVIELDKSAAEEPHELALHFDVTLQVRVIDARGRPQPGTPVEIREAYSPGRFNRRRSAVAEGPEAIARFPHAQRTVRGRGSAEWSVAIDAVLEEAAQVVLDPDALPDELLTLRLPLTGSVEVRVLDDSGSLARDAGDVSLGIVLENQPRHISPFSHVTRTEFEARAKNGIARFQRVDLGKELEVKAVRSGSGVDSIVYGVGPTQAGQQAVFELTLGHDHPVLLVRAVNESGSALGEHELTARIDRRSRYLSGHDDTGVTTDAEGRFRLDLPGGWKEGTTCTLILLEGDPDAPALDGRLDLSRKLVDGTNDLGDLILRAPKIFVAGRVLSQEGLPVPRATLLMERQASGEHDRWEHVGKFSQRADKAGRFVVYGAFTGAAFRMRARSTKRVGKPLVFAAGEEYLVLSVTGAGSIAGSFLLGEGIDASLLRTILEAPPNEPAIDDLLWPNRRQRIEQDGEFELDDLLPGTYVVKVELEGLDEAILEIPGVVVIGGETNRDPRLQGIDLRGQWHPIDLTLTGERQGETLRGTLRYGPSGTDPLPHRRWVNQSTVKLLVSELPVDLSVDIHGYRTMRIEKVSGNRELQLERGPRIRLQLVGAGQVPRPPNFIKVALVPEDSEGGGIDFGAPCFDGRRSILIHAPGTGMMRVQWIVERRAASGAMATMVSLDDSPLFNVLDQVGEQSFELELSQEQVDRLLAALE